MFDLNKKLKDLEKKGEPIRVALCGMGHMGRCLFSQIEDMGGMEVVAVANRNKESITKNLPPTKKRMREIRNSRGGFSRDILAVTEDITLPSALPYVDVVVDATGSCQGGAVIASSAIEGKKDIVSLNVEADTIIGPLLNKLARSAGVVYTVAAGDEPGALKELYDFAAGLGLEVVAAGKGKNNPLDREANPATLADYSRKKGANPRMMASFVDGTKTMIEMACLSNATGLAADCRGMHGPKADTDELTRVFELKESGGILEKTGVVDFVIGDVAPGVFIVYSTRNNILREELKYLLFGDGPNYLLYRPYHLASIEAPLSIACAYFYRQPTIVAGNNLVSDILTVAKADLKAGQAIDGIGGYTVYGLIDSYLKVKKEKLLPIGLSEGCVLVRDKKKGEVVGYDDIHQVPDSMVYDLRKIQEAQFG
ncbi:MAG: NAD(P)H-dependent oxidoreductase [Actinomycetota bacterium]